MAVTLKDIAKQSGVSVSTAGLILGGRQHMYRKETCQKVLTVAKQLNYRPNLMGRSLKTGRSYFLGVLLSDKNVSILSGVLRGLNSILYGNEYSPVVFSHNSIEEEQACLGKCLHRKVDGLIVNTGASPEYGGLWQRYSELLSDKQLPIVEVFGNLIKGAPRVGLDNVAIGRDATEHLLKLGHRRIAMLQHDRYHLGKDKGTSEHFDAWDRYLGYEQAMHRAGLGAVVITHSLADETGFLDEFVAGGLEAAPKILNHPSRPTAVVCYNDEQAYGLYRACRLNHIRIPEQLSVVGYGDRHLSRCVEPPLTTMKVPDWQVGREAAQLLVQMLSGNQVEGEVLVSSEMVVRESTTGPTERS